MWGSMKKVGSQNGTTSRLQYFLILLLGTTCILIYLTVKEKEVTFEDVKDLLQEDPRLINYIKTNVLIPPPLTDTYNGKAVIEKGGNTEHVMALFNNKTNGFFIESGANDGVFISNTLPFEVLLNWTGFLVEPDPVPYKKLAENRRNAWTSHSCMSLEKHPTTVSMWRHKKSPGHSFITDKEMSEGEKSAWDGFTSNCFPFYSFLLALGVTEIDYLALDVEKSELGIFSTIPWEKIYIKVVTIEVHAEFVTPMRNYMESIGYMYIKHIKSGCCTHDQLYIHPKALNELNMSAVVAQSKV